MKIGLNIFRLFLFSLLALFFSACAPSRPRYEKILGTVCFVNLYENGKKSYYTEIFDRLNQIDSEFNLFREDSELYRMNQKAAYEDVPVSDDVFHVLSTALFISDLSGGAFDVSVGPLVKLWNVNSDSPHVATQAELDAVLPLVGYNNIVLDFQKKSVRFKKAGMSVDLGGIAKGFAADEIAKICKKHKVSRAVIDLGGNVYVYGEKEDHLFWNVGVKNPEFPDSPPLVKMSLPQNSVVTSGIYERYFEEGGKRYHHILSPKTGIPLENELYSVTIISDNSMLADALSTTFFILGKSKSLDMLPVFQKEFNTQVSAIFIERNHDVTFSPGFPYESMLLTEGWQEVPKKSGK